MICACTYVSVCTERETDGGKREIVFQDIHMNFTSFYSLRNKWKYPFSLTLLFLKAQSIYMQTMISYCLNFHT